MEARGAKQQVSDGAEIFFWKFYNLLLMIIGDGIEANYMFKKFFF